jgi:hypothetical protein
MPIHAASHSHNSFVQNVRITSISQHTVGDAHKCIKCSQGAIAIQVTVMFNFSCQSVFIMLLQDKESIHSVQVQVQFNKQVIVGQ